MLQAEATETSETVEALAQPIVERADAMRAPAARISGVRRRISAAIAAAADPAAVAAAVADARAARDAFLAALPQS